MCAIWAQLKLINTHILIWMDGHRMRYGIFPNTQHKHICFGWPPVVFIQITIDTFTSCIFLLSLSLCMFIPFHFVLVVVRSCFNNIFISFELILFYDEPIRFSFFLAILFFFKEKNLNSKKENEPFYSRTFISESIQ